MVTSTCRIYIRAVVIRLRERSATWILSPQKVVLYKTILPVNEMEAAADFGVEALNHKSHGKLNRLHSVLRAGTDYHGIQAFRNETVKRSGSTTHAHTHPDNHKMASARLSI
jgi:hypothetical protein